MEQISPHLEIGIIGSYTARKLTEEYARKHINKLVELANLIPQVTYTESDLLANNKHDRILHKKWEHSIVITDELQSPIGFIIGYEREAEKNEQYPKNTIYIGEIVIDPKIQGKGFGKELLRLFIKYNRKVGFLELSGKLNFSVQTNSALFNKKVQDLYLNQGFRVRALKHYNKSDSGDERDDYVYGLELAEEE